MLWTVMGGAELGVDMDGDMLGAASLPSPCTVECVAVRLYDRCALVPEVGVGLPGPDSVPVADGVAAS